MKIQINSQTLLPAQIKIFNSNKRVVGFSAGIGSGKTTALMLKALQLHLTKKNIYNTSDIAVICIDYNKVHQVFAKPFCQLLKKSNINYRYNQSKSTIQTKYGIIRLLTGQNPERLVAYNLTAILIDQIDTLPQHDGYELYIRALGRLRGCADAQLIIVGTNEGYKTIYKIFVQQYDQSKQFITAKTTDNIYLPKSYIYLIVLAICYVVVLDK